MKGRIFVISVLFLVAGTSRARAQVPTVSPSGAAPAPQPAASPPAAPQPVEPIFVPMPGQAPPGGEAEDTGFYYLPEDLGAGPSETAGPVGPTPLYHEVRSGDTLWDICWFYFNNPWEWPRIWSYNRGITNPHWIYPGDRVRLYAEGEEPGQPDLQGDLEQQQSGSDTAEVVPDGLPVQDAPARSGVRIRRRAFVDEEARKQAATVVGSVEEKTMLSEGDSVYLGYPADRPLKAGERYSVYTDTQAVRHPESGKTVGRFVKLLGELEVVSVTEGKRARAVITDSVDVIERGALVGPLPRVYRTVEPQRSEADVQGTIVATLHSDQLIGQGQVIFVDKGESDGLQVGNRMYVVRRGDAYSSAKSSVAQDDRRFPERAIGEVLIVQAGKGASAALVTLALQEIGMGDRVIMRKAR